MSFLPLLLVVRFLSALLIGYTFPTFGIDCVRVSDWLAWVASVPITCDYLPSVNLTELISFTDRIVDELNPEANFTKQEIMKLICEKV